VKKILFALFLLKLSHSVLAQNKPVYTDQNILINTNVNNDQPALPTTVGLTPRKFLVGGASVVGMAGSLYVFTKISNYEYDKNFHTVNDSRVWQQLDKNEHAFIAYSASRYLTEAWEWAGLSRNKAVGLSAASSLVYLSAKEYLDGHKSDWGWSWADMGANVAGITLFAAQELAWQEQKIQFKFSASPRNYPTDLDNRATVLFGDGIPKRLLKDHNAQTYWLSFNLKSLTNAAPLPAWLNLAVGYGADNMWGPYDNIGYHNGKIVFDRTDLQRYRQWYLAPDIDLTKIKTNSKGLKTLLFVLNSVKVPLPTLEFSEGKLKGHAIHF
jgi:uncharacterized protein YfiM (DUF2279 family)